jgi:hypothetical protein
MLAAWEGKIVDVEALERLAVQLWGTAEQCTDLPLQRNLRELVNELIDLIEGSEQSKETIQ